MSKSQPLENDETPNGSPSPEAAGQQVVVVDAHTSKDGPVSLVEQSEGSRLNLTGVLRILREWEAAESSGRPWCCTLSPRSPLLSELTGDVCALCAAVERPPSVRRRNSVENNRQMLSPGAEELACESPYHVLCAEDDRLSQARGAQRMRSAADHRTAQPLHRTVLDPSCSIL